MESLHDVPAIVATAPDDVHLFIIILPNIPREQPMRAATIE